MSDLVTVGALGVLRPGLASARCAPVLGLRGEGELLVRGAVVRNLDTGLHLLLDLRLPSENFIIYPNISSHLDTPAAHLPANTGTACTPPQ